MNKLAYFFWLLIIFLSGCQSSSNKKLTFSENEISVVLDENSTLKSEELTPSDFKKHQGSTPNFGFYKGTVWLKLETSAFEKDALLEIKNSNIDRISFYIYQDHQYQLIEQSGDLFPFDKRKIKHRFFQFPLKNSSSVLLKIENFGDQLFIPLSVRSKNEFAKRDYDEQFIFGIYYGLCLFALMLNLFIYFKINERSTLIYLFYLLGLIVLQLALDGHGFEYFWSNNTYFANHAPPFAASASVFFLTLFTQSFLNTKVFLPKSNKFLTLISFILLLNCVLSLLPFSFTYRFSILAVNVFTLLLNFFILPIAFAVLRKNFRPARYFLLAFIILILSVFAFILRNFGIIPSNVFTEYSLQIGSVFEVTLLTFAIIDRFKSFKTEALNRLEELTKLQAEQNELLETEVAARTLEINEQKQFIEAKNKETLDSINYAKRIQTALIPSETNFNTYFDDAFVLWEPKDIVSGDFYWASKTTTTLENSDNHSFTVFCVGDCTGHGVPGAILCVIGLKLLNLSITNPSINSTSEALGFLHTQFKKTFQNESAGSTIQDGMDIVLCAFDHQQRKLYFSGARNGIYIVRNGELIEYKGDKQSIGSDLLFSNFTQHVIELQKDDTVYLYSDGFADQFGGPKGKKFMYKSLKELLLNCQHLSLAEQKNELLNNFQQWKGDLDQTDDVCIVGVRF